MFEGSDFDPGPGAHPASPASNPAPNSVEASRSDARAAYLDLAMHSGDVYFAIDALGAISNALGMAEIAARVGLTEARLREEFSTNRIDAVTFLRVLAAVGLDFRPEPLAPR